MAKSSNSIIGVFGVLTLVFLLGIAGCASTQKSTTTDNDVTQEQENQLSSENPAKGKPKATDFTMTDGDGNSVKLSELIANGKPIVLNFWASWCPPCKGEMPDFNKVYKKLGNDIQFVMLDLTDGQRETKEIGAKFVKDQGYTFPVYFDTQREGDIAYGIRAIPTTLFINKDGYIINTIQGGIDEETLLENIDTIK